MENERKGYAVLVSSPVPEGIRGRVDRGECPRQDYLEIASRLNAVLMAPARTSWGRGGRLSRAYNLWRVAWHAFRRRREYDLLVTDLDQPGMLIALLFKLVKARNKHVVICHGQISRSFQGRMTRILRLRTNIDRFVCYGALPARRLVEDLRVPKRQVVHLNHAADHLFWKAGAVRPERLISSAGLLRRDYATLVKAVQGLDVTLEVAAHSPWVNPAKGAGPLPPLPGNVRFARLSPVDLRSLYARSLFVAVPLVATPNQAGSLVIYEAMAMGKAVLVTRTQGQENLDLLRDGDNGFCLPIGDVAAWRDRITFLLNNPGVAEEMGKRSRRIVEEGLNLEHFVGRIVAIASAVAGDSRIEDPGVDALERRPVLHV